MTVEHLHVAGYRSIRNLDLELARVNVLVGPNGCGKSNLYRALFLLAEAAQGRLAQAFAAEGGLSSALWAGASKQAQAPQQIELAVGLDASEYALVCGLAPPSRYQIDPDALASDALPSAFGHDPEVCSEQLVTRVGGTRVEFLHRAHRTARIRDADGRRQDLPLALDRSESVLTQLREPHRYPELSEVRAQLLGWRFYHGFRTDPDSPLRAPRVGVFTPALDHDGRDCAAALQTIIEQGGHDRLQQLVDRGIPGARLALAIDHDRALFEIQLEMPGVRRPLRARELSDGTLRYLCLLAALLAPRPPALFALNEPENSLHPDLIPPLADLIADAAARTQLWITTHSLPLARGIADRCGEPPIELELVTGETRAVGMSRFGTRKR